ncbi:MAG: branched-chain amino acid ABC transporter permease [Acidimicrobiales bacterium]
MVEVSTGVAGLLGGGVYALLGLCILLTYRLVAVVNFAQVAVGALGAYGMVIPYTDGVPLVPAIIIGLVVGAVANGLVGLAMTKYFFEGSEDVKAGVTVVMFTALLALGGLLFGPSHPYNFPQPVTSNAFNVAQVGVSWPVVAVIILAIIVAVGAFLFLRGTRTGLLLRALASRPTTSQLIGIAAPRLAMIVWMSTGALTALSLMVIAPTVQNDFSSLSLLLVWGLAAALIGAFRSFWGALIGGLALGALQGVLSSVQSLATYRGALPFVAIILVLMWSQRHARWDAAA